MEKYIVDEMKRLEEQLDVFAKEEENFYQMKKGQLVFYQRVINGMFNLMSVLFGAVCGYDRTLPPKNGRSGISETHNKALLICRKNHEIFAHLLLVLEDRIKAESAKEIAATQNLEQAAQNIGISQTHLERILDRKEEGKLDIDTLRAVCQTLNIPVEYISQ